MRTCSPDFLESVAAALERGLPITAEPFSEIARVLCVREEEVLEAAGQLRDSGVFRHFGAFVDFRAIGLSGFLFGARVGDEAMAALCGWLGELCHVTHIYERDCPVNLWFTAILPGGEALSLLSEELAARGCPHAALLAVRRIKLVPSFASPSKENREHAAAERPAPAIASLGRMEREVLAAAQAIFPLSKRPFARVGEEVGLSEESALESLRGLAARGVLRRVGASLSHVRTGYASNSLIAWDLSELPEEVAAEAGRRTARYSWVSHCYLRNVSVNTLGIDWRYNLYTMIHARNGEELRAREALLSGELRGYPLLSMKTTREHKKTVFRIERNSITEEAWR